MARRGNPFVNQRGNNTGDTESGLKGEAKQRREDVQEKYTGLRG